LDNEWVDKKDIHMDEAIREFKNQNPASETHINRGSVGESLIPSLPYNVHTNTSLSHMDNVNAYYLRSPK